MKLRSFAVNGDLVIFKWNNCFFNETITLKLRAYTRFSLFEDRSGELMGGKTFAPFYLSTKCFFWIFELNLLNWFPPPPKISIPKSFNQIFVKWYFVSHKRNQWEIFGLKELFNLFCFRELKKYENNILWSFDLFVKILLKIIICFHRFINIFF